jgi:hypothetical protein
MWDSQIQLSVCFSAYTLMPAGEFVCNRLSPRRCCCHCENRFQNCRLTMPSGQQWTPHASTSALSCQASPSPSCRPQAPWPCSSSSLHTLQQQHHTQGNPSSLEDPHHQEFLQSCLRALYQQQQQQQEHPLLGHLGVAGVLRLQILCRLTWRLQQQRRLRRLPVARGGRRW